MTTPHSPHGRMLSDVSTDCHCCGGIHGVTPGTCGHLFCEICFDRAHDENCPTCNPWRGGSWWNP